MKVQLVGYQPWQTGAKIPFSKVDDNSRIQNISEERFDVDKLANYAFAKKYYNQKLDNNGKLFDDEKSLLQVLENKKAKDNLFIFFRERAQAELLELNNKLGLSEEEKEKVEGLKEIVQAFPAPAPSFGQYRKSLSFGRNLTDDERLKCHLTIHSAAAACAGISGAMGEGAAIGADTPFLWGTQALMFLFLQNILDVDFGPSLIYAGRQYAMGAYIGVKGARTLISWLGIGGHVATGGTASAPISGTVRAVNATLSTAITEKMGWGYVKSVEQEQMEIKTQLISSAIYAATMGILHFHDQSILDASDYSDVQGALKKISKENLSILGTVMHTISSTLNLPRAGTMFIATLAQGILTAKNMDEGQKKEYFKNLVSVALMNSIFYEVLNVPDDSVIRDDALDAIKKVQADINSTPEIFKEFRELEQEILDKLHLEDLNTRDFIKQFKDKDLLINLAFTTGDLTNILANKLRMRNIEILKEAKKNQEAKLEKERQKGLQLNKKLDPQKKKELDETLKTIVERTKKDLLNKTRTNHALGRIAGYDGTKALLNLSYIEPVKNKKEEEVPNILLFYGPSGSGKTEIGKAIAEDTGSRFRVIKLGMGNENKTLTMIKKQMEQAEEAYQKDRRYTAIQMNEFDDFLDDNPKLLDEFLDFTQNCAKKYHTTLFLTTNNPLSINKQILNFADVTVPMGAGKKEDIKGIVQYYVNNKEIAGYNLDEITEEFEKVKPDYAYSNAQIEKIICEGLPKENCTQTDFISAIRAAKPCITKEINQKFISEQKALEGDK